MLKGSFGGKLNFNLINRQQKIIWLFHLGFVLATGFSKFKPDQKRKFPTCLWDYIIITVSQFKLVTIVCFNVFYSLKNLSILLSNRFIDVCKRMSRFFLVKLWQFINNVIYFIEYLSTFQSKSINNREAAFAEKLLPLFLLSTKMWCALKHTIGLIWNPNGHFEI